jgi:hypothetical protein
MPLYHVGRASIGAISALELDVEAWSEKAPKIFNCLSCTPNVDIFLQNKNSFMMKTLHGDG